MKKIKENQYCGNCSKKDTNTCPENKKTFGGTGRLVDFWDWCAAYKHNKGE